MMTRINYPVRYGILLVVLGVTVVVALANGASDVNLLYLTPTGVNTLLNIRLPRVVAAVVAGAAAAVSGAFLQSALKNPIAGPSIIGVSSAASLFAIIGGILLPNWYWSKTLWAALGGLVVLAVLLKMQPHLAAVELILGGVALNATFSGLLALLPSTSSVSLATITWQQTIVLTVCALVGLMAAVWVAQWGNYLKLSDTKLLTLGLNPQRMRLVLLVIAVWLATTVAAAIGVIAFIGIIVPHFARWYIGRDYNHVVVVSMLAGGWLLLAVDTLGRLIIQPSELPAATLLAIIGGPLLVVILLRMRRGGAKC